jgi:uncharacterized protein
MKQLINLRTKKILANTVVCAQSLPERMKGLLGHSSLPPGQTLWIKPCSSIHTFFMRFAIDAVFVDQDLRVTDVRKNIQPWRLILARRGSHSVFEMAAEQMNETLIQVGDALHVGA